MGKPSIYVAGPMTGLPGFNYPKFRREAAKLRRRGWRVVSPVEMGEALGLDVTGAHGGPDDFLLKTVMDAELRALRNCDAIYLLDGWERSKGARRETVVAISYGLDILFEGTAPRKASRRRRGGSR